MSPTPPTPSHLPTHQKALIFNTTTSTLSLTLSAPLPSPPNEHILAVHSTAITAGELTWAPYTSWPLHHIPCYDVSGTILTSLPNSPFKPGDKVYGRVHADRDGAARRYATILPSEAALVPDGLDLVEACTVPMSALTAWQGMFEHGLLTGTYTPGSVPHINMSNGEVVGGQAKGKRVLILGAAGAVGSMGCQFAKLAGAWVAGTASSQNFDFLKGLGVDAVIDYTSTSMKEWVGGEEARKFDLVFDCVGGESMLDGWCAVREDGVYVSVAPGFKEPEGGKPGGVRSKWFIMESRGGELAGIGRLIEKGVVRGVRVDSVWKIEDFEKAFGKTAGGHARGKVVIKIAEDEK